VPSDNTSKEQRILRVTRKVLANIVKDTATAHGMQHPLSDGTIQDIRELFELISVRERELALEAGVSGNEKPYYTDEPQTSTLVAMPKPTKKLN